MARYSTPSRLAFLHQLTNRRCARWKIAKSRRSIETIEVDDRSWFSGTENLHRRPLGLDARDGDQRGEDGHSEQALSHARGPRKGHTVEMDWESFTYPA